MAKVINLNRFRKKKAKAEKEQRAERNRRYHGRTQAERLLEDFEKRKLEKKLDGAFLIPERIELDKLIDEDAKPIFDALQDATEPVVSLSEFSARLRAEKKKNTEE